MRWMLSRVAPLWALSACASAPRTDPVAESASLALTHVRVVDVESGRVLPDQTVLIAGDQIVRVAPASRARVPVGAQAIDATGKYLIPGLWDMHVHALDEGLPEVFFPLFVANGVTGVREMHTSSPLERVARLRSEIAGGRLLGPRLVVAGPILDAPPSAYRGAVSLGTAEQGRAAVDSLARAGSEEIKVSSLLGREAYLAVADEARRRGLAVVGHVPFSVSSAEASDAGHRSMEHLFGILLACSSKEDELRREALEALRSANPPPMLFSRLLFALQTEALLATHNPQKCAALFERFVQNGTWQVPTFVTLRAGACAEDPRLTRDPRLRYMPARFRTGWERTCAARRSAYTPEDMANRRRQFQRELELFAAARRAGVGVLAGSDVTNAYVIPGFSLHEELEVFVDAGLSPLEALQSATLNPARYLEATDSLGAVKAGRRADLVLLSANPLEDIRNTRKIEAVVLNGRYLDREALDALLADAERAANAPAR